MFCRKCGFDNHESAYTCIKCGEPLQVFNQPSQSRTVPNYLVQSILVTLFCCIPFGIVSIVYAAQVNSKLQAGDYHGAIYASEQAKKWCWIAFIFGIIAGIISFLVNILPLVTHHNKFIFR